MHPGSLSSGSDNLRAQPGPFAHDARAAILTAWFPARDTSVREEGSNDG